jgi:phosphoribosylaminoimidazole-succinocarboxamide synthase
MGQLLKTTDFHFPGQKGVYRGKVRDVYDLGGSLLLIATDRYSAFDRNLAFIPYKGELVTAISRWWFEQTEPIIKNHIKGHPDSHVAWGKKYNVVPIEMVVRGFITGVTNTSLWYMYSQGQRDFGDLTLPEGLQKNQRLPEPVITPTTKLEEHDRPLTPEEAVKEGLIDEKLWQQIRDAALKLYIFGQKTAFKKGLILVDTKYEFGQEADGSLVLIDEVHTPDSSRYWLAETYQERVEAGEEPDYYDKEFLRLWFKERFDPYKDKDAPEASVEAVEELSRRYRYIYEQLLGQPFAPAEIDDLQATIEANVLKALAADEKNKLS